MDANYEELYKNYEELLIKRDQLYKEAGGIQILYTKEFGDLITKVFEEKIECIKKKKAIEYCQAIINKGGFIDKDDLASYLDKNMALYNRQLKDLIDENNSAKKSKQSSIADVERAKKIYRRIAKKIHPDIHPDLAGNSKLIDLWAEVQIAYGLNNAVKLSELEIMINKVISDLGIDIDMVDIPDIEDKISAVESEINGILTTEPYTYEDLLSDKEAIAKKKAELEEELKKHKEYNKELENHLNELVSFGDESWQTILKSKKLN